MELRELKQLVENTADAAFAVDGVGELVAWNAAAETLFGWAAVVALGQHCSQLLQGADECGQVCSKSCSILQATQNRRPMHNFDLQVQTGQGRQWCNISVLIVGVANSTQPYSLHLICPMDTRKRLEMALQNFILNEAKLSPEDVHAIVATSRLPTCTVVLSSRELEVLRLLAKSTSTGTIAAQLRISRTTVNNHIQNMLKKLGAHSRLEAIRRAEHAGLI